MPAVYCVEQLAEASKATSAAGAIEVEVLPPMSPENRNVSHLDFDSRNYFHLLPIFQAVPATDQLSPI